MASVCKIPEDISCYLHGEFCLLVIIRKDWMVNSVVILQAGWHTIYREYTHTVETVVHIVQTVVHTVYK